MTRCPKCGNQSPEGALYCGVCYEPFRKAAPAPAKPEPAAGR